MDEDRLATWLRLFLVNKQFGREAHNALLRKYAFVKVELHSKSDLLDFIRGERGMTLVAPSTTRRGPGFESFSMTINFMSEAQWRKKQNLPLRHTRGRLFRQVRQRLDSNTSRHNLLQSNREGQEGQLNKEVFVWGSSHVKHSATIGSHEQHALDQAIQQVNDQRSAYILLIGDRAIARFCEGIATSNSEQFGEVAPARKLGLAIHLRSLPNQSPAQAELAHKHVMGLVTARWWSFAEALVTMTMPLSSPLGGEDFDRLEAACVEAGESLATSKWRSATDMLEQVNRLVHEAEALFQQRRFEDIFDICESLRFLIDATMNTLQFREFARVEGFRQKSKDRICFAFYMSSKAALELTIRHFALMSQRRIPKKDLSHRIMVVDASLVCHYAHLAMWQATTGLRAADDWRIDFEADGKMMADLYFLRASAQMYLGRFNEAKEVLKLALELRPDGTSPVSTPLRMSELSNMIEHMREKGTVVRPGIIAPGIASRPTDTVVYL